MHLRRYDVLLCDADDTLLDFKRAEANAFAVACRFARIEPAPEALALYSRLNDGLWKLLERGGITQDALRVRRFERFLEETGAKACAQEMAAVYEDALSRETTPLPGAEAAVRRWREILPVVVVTNGIASIQRGRMGRSPIGGLIADMVISEEVGAAKPNPRMLDIALARAGVSDRSRALVLGDSLTSDMCGAANAGLDACWFNPRGLVNASGLRIRYEVRALDEVDAILNGEEEEAGA